MLKFILILILIAYVFFKIGGFLFRILFQSAFQQQQRHYQQRQANEYRQYRKKAPNSNLNIDYMPENGRKKERKKSFSGGEYVEYEEV